jgi:hypothetical protein
MNNISIFEISPRSRNKKIPTTPMIAIFGAADARASL